MKIPKSLFLATAVVAVGGGFGWWWHHETIYPSTDDAYVEANILTISPQVSGTVDEVDVSEAAYVKANAPLLALNEDTLQASVDAAQAQLDAAIQGATATTAQLSAAQAQRDGAQSAFDEAEKSYQRELSLFEKGDLSQSALDNALSARNQASAQLDQAEASVKSIEDQMGGAVEDNANVRMAEASLKQAEIALAHASLVSPVSGWVANLSLRPGDVVNPGQSLFSIVEDGDWWVDANFSEKELKRIRVGQDVNLKVDMYPDLKLTGHVESIGAGSGSAFSLLPAQNATGNWVKVTQRFPVRIAIDAPTDPSVQLRVGSSVSATVDTSALDQAS